MGDAEAFVCSRFIYAKLLSGRLSMLACSLQGVVMTHASATSTHPTVTSGFTCIAMLNDCVYPLKALAASSFAHKMLKYELSSVCSENSSFFDIVPPLEGFSEDCLMIAASVRSAKPLERACDTVRLGMKDLLTLV